MKAGYSWSVGREFLTCQGPNNELHWAWGVMLGREANKTEQIGRCLPCYERIALALFLEGVAKVKTQTERAGLCSWPTNWFYGQCTLVYDMYSAPWPCGESNFGLGVQILIFTQVKRTFRINERGERVRVSFKNPRRWFESNIVRWSCAQHKEKCRLGRFTEI